MSDSKFVSPKDKPDPRGQGAGPSNKGSSNFASPAYDGRSKNEKNGHQN